LKHQILVFDIEFAAPDVRVDFTSSLWDLRDGLFNLTKLMRALGGGLIPRVVTDMKDARTEVDERLRTVIGELVAGWSKRMTEPILSSTNIPKVNGDQKRGGQKSRNGSVGSPPTTEDAAAALKVREAMQRNVPLIRKKLDEYIPDVRTKDMLLRAVWEDVMSKYATWLDDHGFGSAGPYPGKAKGKGREDGVWEEHVFAEWAIGVFGLDSQDDADIDEQL
jgi:hypothetical protein